MIPFDSSMYVSSTLVLSGSARWFARVVNLSPRANLLHVMNEYVLSRVIELGKSQEDFTYPG